MDAPLEDQGASPAVGNSISPKKSGRRSAQKRVVSVPVPEVEGTRQKAGGGETSPPSDSWTWRKYGQKPIKGSPYPRGYYRCSSSKGCPARKQVERSRTDPTVFIVTYSFEHNHSWPLPRNHHRHHHHSSSVMASSHEPKPDAEPSPSELASDPEEKFSELIVEETSLMIPDDFRWPSASSTAAIDDGILYGTLCGGLTTVDDCEKFSSGVSGVAMDEEEDALFAGLGELPECSVVFQRGFLDRPMRGGDEAKRCGMEADETASAATASWCHGTGL